MKVLIISHNPFSETQNMGKMLCSLFSAFDKEELCQLYTYPSLPSVDKCASYLRMTDQDALRGVFSFHVNPKELMPTTEVPTDEKPAIYQSPNRKRYSLQLVRDAVWKCSHWYNKEVKKWIYDQRPTHIFVAVGSAKFLYDIAIRISKDNHIPIISYFCDDYYGQVIKHDFIGKIWQRLLRRTIKRMTLSSLHVITVCDLMSEYYKKEFKRDVLTIMTGNDQNSALEGIGNTCKRVQRLTYMGNVSLKRYESLLEIGSTLNNISTDGRNCYLDIYTGNVSEDVVQQLNSCPNIRLHGFVIGEEYNSVFRNAEAFIHVESFDEKMIERVKYSISTKISNVLASGIPLFAYGPDMVASIRFLKENDCAVVVTTRDELEKQLLLFLDDSSIRKDISDNGRLTAKEYNDSLRNSHRLKRLFED